MTPDLTSLEAELRSLRAAEFDDAFFARLEAAADDSLVTLSPDELRFEETLRQTPLPALSPAHLTALEEIVATTPFAVTDKILLFPVSGAPQHKPQRSSTTWRAAAAVAVIGAFSALLIPTGEPSDSAKESGQVASRPASGNFIPASFDRNVSTVKNEGFIWGTDQSPKSVIRVEYKDKIIYRDSLNRTFQIEQPRVQFLAIPAKTD